MWLREALETPTGVANTKGAERAQAASPKGKPHLLDAGGPALRQREIRW